MTAVVFGAGGMLGRRLTCEFPEASAYTRSEADLTDASRVEALVVPGVTLVLNAAAHTRVDEAESDPAHLLVNAEGVASLARRCREIGAVLVHVSTDYVFGGRGTRPYREEEAVDPVNAYGAGKLAGERGIADSGAEALVVRTSWVYGVGGANFVDAILKQAEAGKTELRVVADQTGRPTYAADLARAIRLLVERGARGTVHFANAGETTWFDFAREALRIAGREDVLVRPCSSAEFPRPARRPAYSVLDTSLYEKTAGEKPRPWREALRDYVETRRA